jgi:predicted ribosomally synthesized peptide with SipW-like signal peptide
VPRIFVSYRNSDAPTEAGRITDWLDNHFGEADVFMAVKPGDIRPGEKFLAVIERSIGSVDGLVAIIGTGWLNAEDAAGRKRLENANDILRREVATALQRGILVIPVLVQGATMPSDEDLPSDLKGLAYLQALSITNADWSNGMKRLIDALDTVAHPSVHTVEDEEEEDVPVDEIPVTVPMPVVPQPRLIGPLATLAGLVGSLLLLSGVLVKTSTGSSFLEPGFGGPGNFRNSDILWRMAGVFTTLPTVAIAIGAVVAVLRARRGTASESRFGAGLLTAFGVQGTVYYAAVLTTRAGHGGGFALALIGGLIVLAVGVWAYWTETAGLPQQFRDANLGPGVRFSLALGAVLTFVGMFVDFNGGGSGSSHPHAGSIWSGPPAHFERWDLLVVALIVVAIAVFPRVAGPQPVTAGFLLASGLGTAFVWLRFLAIPALQSSDVASVGVGAFIGMGGATLIAVTGLVAHRWVRADEPIAATIAHA